MISLKTVIRTKDYDVSKLFYTQILNLNIIEEYNDCNGVKGIILSIDKGNNGLIEISEILEVNESFQSNFNEEVKSDKISLQIKTDDIEFWSLNLKSRYEFTGPILKPWGAYYLYLRDPDGIQIVFYQEASESNK